MQLIMGLLIGEYVWSLLNLSIHSFSQIISTNALEREVSNLTWFDYTSSVGLHHHIVSYVCMSMSAMRQNIDIVVSLVRKNKVKMNTYDNHVQEFEVCYIVDDLMTLKESNKFDLDEIQNHSELVNTNENSMYISSHHMDCYMWLHGVSMDRYPTDWDSNFDIPFPWPE